MGCTFCTVDLLHTGVTLPFKVLGGVRPAWGGQPSCETSKADTPVVCSAHSSRPGPYPPPRSNCSASVVNGVMIVFGGGGGASAATSSSNSSSNSNPSRSGRGGRRANGAALSTKLGDVWALVPGASSSRTRYRWCQPDVTGSLPSPRSYHASAVVGKKKKK